MSAFAVDRRSDLWLRLRAAVCNDSPIDKDRHTDCVFLDLERHNALKHSTAVASESFEGTLLATAARRNSR